MKKGGHKRRSRVTRENVWANTKGRGKHTNTNGRGKPKAEGAYPNQ